MYQILAYGDKPPRKGASSVTFLKFCPKHIFVIGKVSHFKFRVLIDTEEYKYMHDNKYYSQKDVFRVTWPL